ncbi:hypothetical protein DFH07DRAFT_768326 [Mycena maculata]|uniref:Uncharacterized protein n=1 Tax=Mycena maculata TaxID=230809 RepID=A0AAD7JT59_9AGAR|nr:hypothetical protein DFH07DRAFT_768326 [Mycena maculata]
MVPPRQRIVSTRTRMQAGRMTRVRAGWESKGEAKDDIETDKMGGAVAIIRRHGAAEAEGDEHANACERERTMRVHAGWESEEKTKDDIEMDKMSTHQLCHPRGLGRRRAQQQSEEESASSFVEHGREKKGVNACWEEMGNREEKRHMENKEGNKTTVPTVQEEDFSRAGGKTVRTTHERVRDMHCCERRTTPPKAGHTHCPNGENALPKTPHWMRRNAVAQKTKAQNDADAQAAREEGREDKDNDHEGGQTGSGMRSKKDTAMSQPGSIEGGHEDDIIEGGGCCRFRVLKRQPKDHGPEEKRKRGKRENDNDRAEGL